MLLLPCDEYSGSKRARLVRMHRVLCVSVIEKTELREEQGKQSSRAA